MACGVAVGSGGSLRPVVAAADVASVFPPDERAAPVVVLCAPLLPGSGVRERWLGSLATAVSVPVAAVPAPVEPPPAVRPVGSGGFVAVAASAPCHPMMLAAVRGAVTLVGAKETRVVPVMPVVD